MKRTLLVLALFAGAALASEDKPRLRTNPDAPCRKKSSKPILASPGEPLPVVNAPDQWIWNNVESTNYLTNIRN
jgi:hypothetical protein